MSNCKRPRFLRAIVLMASLVALSGVRAFDPETIGLSALRRERPGLTGAGVRVAQPEGEVGPGAWQVQPSVNGSVLFTWASDLGLATNYPNAVGSASGHANGVGEVLFGSTYGVAPGVTSVDSYEGNYFINAFVVGLQPIPARIINQSFIITELPSTNVDFYYDAYTEQYDVLFISGVNNAPGTPPAPGTAYNSIAVGVYFEGSQSSIGPTIDGRSKPDLVSVEPVSSTATPDVAGGAALLLQAAAAEDAGPGTAALATNATTIKALLLNGAVKMTNWTNGATRPLDARYGAGVLNIYNSDQQLRGGRFAARATNGVSVGAPHPPTGATNDLPARRGWDVSTIESTVAQDQIAHYCFTLPASSATHAVTATLVWKKIGVGALTNLDLFLYHMASNTLVASSTSAVDNVEHLFVPSLRAGRYDLQVLKRGGAERAGHQSYALAFDFSPTSLTIARSGLNHVLSWPASPAGFSLQSSPSLNDPLLWQAVTNQSALSNAQNTTLLSAGDSTRFFRLFRP